MKKKIITIAIVVVVVFLLALPKLKLFSSEEKEAMPAGGGAGQAKLPVEAIVIKPERLDNKLIITGSVLPNESLELKSEVSGKISSIYFKEGKKVRRGDLLVEINDDELVAQLEKQKYNQKLNEDNEFRQRKLLEKDAISQEEYDNALNRLNTTFADIRLLEAQLAKTKIRAPFDGTIGLRFVSEGAFINSSTVIATLYNLSPAKIDFAIPGRYSTQIATGKKIYFTIENDSRVFEGAVFAIEPQIDPNTRTLKVRAIADNRYNLLLPGQFVRVELILETVQNAILIPSEAVVPELTGHKVYISKNGKASETPVTIGIRTDRNVEIISGVNPGDTVITTGMLQLRNGIDVALTKVQ
ncbi:MAG: efflux RND transporter periplasmic adaptor subunit [Cyclobacteriaceae bacterium]|jgi:membrane fusion protein (multidrug efflux system)|nr:efflux RND transporter periplasmic adaptor subunit [Cyclobacteriaceae bacterium]